MDLYSGGVTIEVFEFDLIDESDTFVYSAIVGWIQAGEQQVEKLFFETVAYPEPREWLDGLLTAWSEYKEVIQ